MALGDLEANELDILLMSPEQFANEDVLRRLRDAKPFLFVVDEAHCISEWGDNFRPDYLRLGPVIESLGHPTVRNRRPGRSRHVRRGSGPAL